MQIYTLRKFKIMQNINLDLAGSFQRKAGFTGKTNFEQNRVKYFKSKRDVRKGRF